MFKESGMPASSEKNPIKADEAAKKLLQYVTDLDSEKLEAYFKVFDVPAEALENPELQAKVQEMISFLEGTEHTFLSEERRAETLDVLKKHF